jgi:DNA primase
MARLDADEISEIKSRVAITDVIGQYVKLTKAGRNYIGLCPFHSEKTPSFSVNAEKGFYHCFGCKKSGDVIRFIEDYKGVDFQTALTEVAGIAGVTVTFEGENEKENPNAALYEANNQAARIYQTVLASTEIGVTAREYLAARGLDDAIIKAYGVGLAPDEPDFLYQNLSVKFDEGVLANSGLFNFSQNQVFDSFQNRLMFPILNQYGQTVGFSGRIWQEGDERPGKYVNTPATAIFDKSYELYNLQRAKAQITKSHEVYLMEGFMDVIAAHKAGIDNVVASMGTALTEKHVKRLRQLAQKFILAYDGDSAGQHAIERAIELTKGLDVQIVRIPDALDPDEFEKRDGPEALSDLMRNYRLARSEFLMDYLRPSNLTSVASQMDFLKTMAPIIASEASIQAQDIYLRRLVDILPDFEYNQVEETVNRYRESTAASGDSLSNLAAPPMLEDAPQEAFAPSSFQQPPVDPVFDSFQKLTPSEHTELQLLARMLSHPELIARYSEDKSIAFSHAATANFYTKLILEEMKNPTLVADALLSNLTDDEKTLYYQIQELNLPDEVSESELEDLTISLQIERLKKDLHDLEAKSAQAKTSGDHNKELELALQTVKLQKALQQKEGERRGR